MYIEKDKNCNEIKAQADAEMKAGKLDGIASVKWSTGSSYEGRYKAGVFSGRGSGAAEFKDGKLNGSQPQMVERRCCRRIF